MKHFQNKQPDANGNLRWASACPLCGAEYSPEEARIVSEKESAFLVHTNCKKCGSSVVATLIANHSGVSSVGLVTDLTYEDVIKFKDSDVVSTDDLLDAYNIFKDEHHLEHIAEAIEESS